MARRFVYDAYGRRSVLTSTWLPTAEVVFSASLLLAYGIGHCAWILLAGLLVMWMA